MSRRPGRLGRTLGLDAQRGDRWAWRHAALPQGVGLGASRGSATLTQGGPRALLNFLSGNLFGVAGGAEGCARRAQPAGQALT